MKKVLPFISILLFFLIGTSCHSDDPYQWQGRDKEEMLNLFHSNPAPFQELADIFIQNDTFWERPAGTKKRLMLGLCRPMIWRKCSILQMKNKK